MRVVVHEPESSLPDNLQQAEYEPVVPGDPWVFIAVMGVTGSGKSTFIRTISGDDSVLVGDGLKSCTSDLKGYSFHYKGFNVNLVDSPGFNDTYRSETSILQDIATWLRESYEGDEKQKLTGIVYLHSISHSRMEGSAMRNLKMFRELCGPEPLKNVVLATTFWGQVEPQIGIAREAELTSTPEFWGNMLKRGSRLAKFTNLESGREIIDDLLGSKPQPLKIQRELVDEQISLIETGAGQMVNEELTRLTEQHRKEKEEMQQEMAEALQARDKEMQEILAAEQERVEQEISKLQRQQVQLKADERSSRRRLQNDFENRLWELENRNSELQDERSQQAQRIRNLERYNEEAQRRWGGLELNEVIAKVRAEESKLRADERILLEAEIANFKAKIEPKIPESTTDSAEDAGAAPEKKEENKHKRRAKKVGEVLIMVLRTAVPIATLITIGMPIHLPGANTLLDQLQGNNN